MARNENDAKYSTSRNPLKEQRIPDYIRLDNSRASHAFTKEESLWEDEIQRMLKMINEHVETLGNSTNTRNLTDRDYIERNHYNSGDVHDHTHRMKTDMPFLSISLFGTYGSGKSSLLRTFVQRIQSHMLGEYTSYSHLQEKIYCLDLVEPNLLVNDDQFLYAFLATALEEDQRVQKRKRYEDLQILSNVQQVFQEISENLQAVDKALTTGENDPLGASLERLERHSSALRLRNKIWTFLDVLADALNNTGRNSIVILPVDDADMSFEGLISTLDTLKRYLQHPRLVPIFSFTSRLAEELLQAHFGQKLEFDKSLDPRKYKEAGTNMTITESLALQHLAKLFPVRHRIRLGPAPARVQQSFYTRERLDHCQKDYKDDERKRVYYLLTTGSRMLFGCSEYPATPLIRAPLVSSTLRRQIQVIDAMEAASIVDFIPNKPNLSWASTMELKRGWGQTFDRAAWSLLNVHRDLLKEFRLDLDDLYSWAPEGLQQVILTSILKKDLAERRKIIKQWRYRTEDRRSQMISLLAAIAFRPSMYQEEIKGGNPNELKAKIERTRFQKEGKLSISKAEHQWFLRSFSIRKGSIWFLRLWIGFYLPQLLARNRFTDEEKAQNHKQISDDLPPMVSPVGWTLVSGPVHAIREALHNRQISSCGMLFLDPKAFNDSINENIIKEDSPDYRYETVDHWEDLLGHLWCYYGINLGKCWAALSLWRGLSLMGKLLESAVYHRASGEEAYMDEKAGENRHRHNRINKIVSIIYEHLDQSEVLGDPPRDGSQPHFMVADEVGAGFGHWSLPNEVVSMKIELLAMEIDTWLMNFTPDQFRIKPMQPLAAEDHDAEEDDKADSKKDDPKSNNVDNERPYDAIGKRNEWKACFTRRVHGENLIRLFWQKLEIPSRGETPVHISTEKDPKDTPGTPLKLERKKTNSNIQITIKSAPPTQGHAEKWVAQDSLIKWIKVLMSYWECGRDFHHGEPTPTSSQNLTQSLISECPIIAPFTLSETEIRHEIHSVFKFTRFLSAEIEKTSKPNDDEVVFKFSYDKIIRTSNSNIQNIEKELSTLKRSFESKSEIHKYLKTAENIADRINREKEVKKLENQQRYIIHWTNDLIAFWCCLSNENISEDLLNSSQNADFDKESLIAKIFKGGPSRWLNNLNTEPNTQSLRKILEFRSKAIEIYKLKEEAPASRLSRLRRKHQKLYGAFLLIQEHYKCYQKTTFIKKYTNLVELKKSHKLIKQICQFGPHPDENELTNINNAKDLYLWWLKTISTFALVTLLELGYLLNKLNDDCFFRNQNYLNFVQATRSKQPENNIQTPVESKNTDSEDSSKDETSP